MAFPTTGVLDDFNRSDRSLAGDGGWSTGGINSTTNSLSISTNQVAASGGNPNGRWGTAAGPDVELYCDVPVPPTGGNYVFLAGRVSDAGTGNWDGYGVIAIQSTPWIWQIRRYTNGSSTTLGGNLAAPPTVNIGDGVGLEIIGTTISAYHKPAGGSWTLVGSRVDATYAAAGAIGMELGGTGTRADNLGGGTVVVGGGSTPLEVTRQLAWDIENAVSSSRAVVYAILNAVTSSCAVVYDSKGTVSSSRAVAYAILNAVTSSRAIAYDIENAVQSARAVAYDIKNALASSRTVAYDIKNAVQSARAVAYDIKNTVSSSRALGWDIKATVTSSRAIAYDIADRVTAARNVLYDIQGAAGAAVPERAQRGAGV